MKTPTPTDGQQSQTSTAQDISDPNISFADYERLRLGGAGLEDKGETSEAGAEEDAEPKAPAESEPAETEETEEEGNESTESEADEAEEEEEPSEKTKTKKKGGFQRRIEKKNAEIRARDARINELERELASKGAGKPEPKAADSKPAAEGKPKLEDYDTHAEYVEALTDWKLEQRDKERAEKEANSKLESEQKEIEAAHLKRVKEFRKKTPDYAEVITGAVEAGLSLSPAVDRLLLESDVGPEVLYEMAKDLDEFERINSLGPIAAAREIGKLEAKLAKSADAPKPEIKKTTKAPKPIEPVAGSGGKVVKSIYDPNLPFSEYERIRKEQDRRKQG
jgi:hypothetical protein